MRVLHLITGLNTGGAELMLLRLLAATDRDRYHPTVVSLTDVGPVGDGLRSLGVEVRALGMRRGPLGLLDLFKLLGLMRRESPQVVQTWLSHANLFGGLSARLLGIPVIWGIHDTQLGEGIKASTHRVALVAGRLSAWCSDRIVCCAEAARQAHVSIGYAAEKMAVIPNGFDPLVFRPDPAARAAVRQELGIPEEAPLIGLVARYDPRKDHGSFLEAAERLLDRHPEVHFLLCGSGVEAHNPDLRQRIEATGASDRFHLLGRREDLPRLQASLDIATSSSFTEALPLAIGEAMACGVPCAVTDVGDSARLVGESGKVVPARDPVALAAAWEELLALGAEGRQGLGEAARRRIEEQFSLSTVIEEYERLYRELGGS